MFADTRCIFEDRLIRAQSNSIFRKDSKHILTDTFRICKQDRIVFGNIGIGYCNWCAGHIVCADIIQPRNAVQSIDKNGICIMFRQFFTQLADFLCSGLSRIFYRQSINFRSAFCRTILPKIVCVINLVVDLNILFSKGLLHALDISGREKLSIDANNRIFRQFFSKILRNLWSFRLIHFKKDTFAACKLSFCLHIVAPICPQAGDRFSNHESSCRTCESGQPCPGFPVIRKVFAHMRICTWDNHRIDFVLRHFFTDFCNLFICGHFFYFLHFPDGNLKKEKVRALSSLSFISIAQKREVSSDFFSKIGNFFVLSR